MSDERLDRILADEVREAYGAAETPREEIWAGIENARSRHGQRRAWGRVAAGLAAAAVLAALLVGRPGRRAPLPGSPPSPAAAATPAPDLLLREHLARTGRLLASASGAKAPTLAGEARPLLAATRVLLEAPGHDPATERLLEDSEVALALVVRIRPGAPAVERTALAETLEETRLVGRLRAAAGGAGG